MIRQFLTTLFIFGLTACDTDRIAKLEKENAELRADLEKQKRIVDLDTQGKCSAAAEHLFNIQFGAGKNTITLDYHNHYNRSLGKCFVMIEWHYRDVLSRTGSWFNLGFLYDAYENQEVGKFSQYTDVGADFEPHLSIQECEVAGNKCGSIEEFNRKSTPFMSN